MSTKLKQDKPTRLAVQMFNEGMTKEAFATLGLEDKALAAWLHHTYGLDCTLLGDVLGDPKHKPLMTAYITKLAFHGATLDNALRMLLKGFRLPGEAQKIDRIMDCFASHWVSQQPQDQNEMKPDTAYVVSFALIMLNTDLHNPAIKRKMSLPDFQHSLRGVAGGEDLPSAWLAALYKSIKETEFCLKSTLTERRRPCAIVPDLSQECLEKLRRQMKFKGAVSAVIIGSRMAKVAGVVKKNPSFSVTPSDSEEEEQEQADADKTVPTAEALDLKGLEEPEKTDAGKTADEAWRIRMAGEALKTQMSI